MSLSSFWPEFIALYIANFLNLLSPGVETTLMFRNSALFSRKIGFFTGLGIVLGSFIHKAYSFFGFGMVVARSPFLFNTIKFIGAGYLVYVGVMTFLPHVNAKKTLAQKYILAMHNKELTPLKAFRMGLVVDLLHPMASLFFISLLATTVSEETPLSIKGLYALSLVATSFIWYTCQAFFFSTPKFSSFFQKRKQLIDRISGGVLIGLAMKIAFLTVR